MILGQASGTGEEVLIHIVPPDHICLIDEITVCNTDNTPHAFSIRFANGDEPKSSKQYICAKRNIEANSTISLGNNIQLPAYVYVYVKGPLDALVFSVYGSQVEGNNQIITQVLSAGSAEVLFQAPDISNISKIIVCNTNSSSDLKYSLRVVRNGEGPEWKHYYYYQSNIAPCETIELPAISLESGDSIYVEDNNQEIAYSCFGSINPTVVPAPVYSDLIFLVAINQGSNSYSIIVKHKTGVFAAVNDSNPILIPAGIIYVYLGIEVNSETDIILNGLCYDKVNNVIVSCSINSNDTNLEITIVDRHWFPPIMVNAIGVFWIRRIS